MRCAIRVRREGIEPDDTRGELRVHQVAGGAAVEVERPLEIARTDVGAVTPPEQFLDLGIGFAAPEAVAHVDERHRRYR